MARLQVARRELAATEGGRAFVVGLLSDSRLTVRLWAPSHALHWGDVGARNVLQTIAGDPDAGLNSLNAEMTLKEFDAGRLNPDW